VTAVDEFDRDAPCVMENPTRYKLFFTKHIDKRLNSIGLSEGHLYFILALDENKGMSLKEMTEKVQVHKSLTTRAVRNLIDNEFAKDLKESGKEYSLVLTEKGKHAKEKSIRALAEVTDMILGGLSKEELDELGSMVRKIQCRMDEVDRKELEDNN
jgi:DNA-binding MarR family transcriptional regulator